ncbi:hypothetical protein NQZ68_040762 [Dissostichus eleginoides]|nr:hypothetical protein NQZ68_040762 [Dissostichus eleginoides]
MSKKPQSGAQTAAQQQGSFLDSMPKKPQVRATSHAHAALAQLEERVWPGMWKIQVRVTARVWTGTTTLLSVLEDGLHNYSGKYELDWSEAGHSCNDKGHGVAVPASEPANAAHRPLLTLGLKD